MPYKPCPKCKTPNGVRTLKCECGFRFRKSKPYKKKSVPHKKKAVSHKKSTTAHKKKNIIVKPKPQSKKLLSQLTPKPKQKTPVAWTDLEKGDKIRVFKDSGPRMILSDGVEICIGHYGIFTVHKLDLHGIHAYGKNGYSFLWMGDNQFSTQTGIKRIKHKIKKLSHK